MKPDFSGWASKNDLLCSDGRTIKQNAFAHQDGTKVPLVWQHQHNSPENVLGYAILKNKPEGVYTQAFFNDTPAGNSAKKLVMHGDVNQLSIFARQLTQKGRDVVHGNIKEVSLVLAGANPEAFIDVVNDSLAHGDESSFEAEIYTGLFISHSDSDDEDDEVPDEDDEDTDTEDSESDSEDNDGDNVDDVEVENKSDATENDGTNNEGDIVGNQQEEDLEHADGDMTVKDVYESMSKEQKDVLHYMVGEALESNDGSVEHSGISPEDLTIAHQEGFEMARNVFETQSANGGTTQNRTKLSHGQVQELVQEAYQGKRSFKDTFLAHADEILPEDLQHADGDYGIDDIEFLFPDARLDQNGISLISRRTEWVADVLSSTRHSPFSRIKSLAADLTADEARAKGYVKATRKKDEVIKLLKRVTGPKTIYKKQKLDRDDIIDIVDIDVVAWIKAEMRVMLDEEIARAILIGDGRDADDEDKIDEDHIRPIAWDDEMYSHVVTLGASATALQTNEAITRALADYKGSGNPTFYTTQRVLSDLLLDKDTLNRRFYDTRQQLAAALGVKDIVPVEVMEDAPELVGVIVNLADYTVGADRGGEINFFDDFDIDFNQMKYLLETRISGALTKPKSALVIKRNPGTVVTPAQPNYNGGTHTITIPSTTGVIYSINGVDKAAAATVVITEDTQVEARPATNYSFPHTAERVFDISY